MLNFATSTLPPFQTNVGPIVVSMNPYRDVGNPLTLASTKSACAAGTGQGPDAIQKVVQEVLRLQGETGYPQVRTGRTNVMSITINCINT